MIDVILPVLDEAEALPWVLGRMPEGYRAIVADNGSTDGSGDIARGLGALVADEPQPGFGAACFAGLTAATAPIVCFMDCDGSLDPQRPPAGRNAARRRSARPGAGSARACCRRVARPRPARKPRDCLSPPPPAGGLAHRPRPDAGRPP